MPQETADTFESYKVILLANGTVKAIPAATPAPGIPTGLGVTPKLSSVRVAWTPGAHVAQTIVYRDNVQIASTVAAAYRDLAIEAGETYAYKVQTVDAYGQRSSITAAVSAFVDPDLNVAPTVSVRAWPPVFSTNGRTLLRVNAGDVDAQTLELELEVDEGTIEATDDPSVWLYTPA